jgi:hypothetical protein
MRESTIVAEWQAEARAQVKRSDLLEVLEQRFGTPIPPELVAVIEGQANIEILSRWFKAALKAETLEAFRGAVAELGDGSC